MNQFLDASTNTSGAQIPKRRDLRLDVMRGICVVGMISWHLMTAHSFPKWLSFPTIQAFNFVAEGFVLLAGASVAIGIQRGRVTQRGVIFRAFHLLGYHFAILACLLGLNSLGLITLKGVSTVDFALVRSSILLQYQPYLADVLTLFFFLFLLTPVILWCWKTLGQWGLLAISLSIFILGQPQATSVFPQLNAHGAFDVNTWQIVYCIGFLFGVNLDRVSLLLRKHCALLLLTVFAVMMLGLRFAILSSFEQPQRWFSRHPMTPLRLLYALSQLWLIACLLTQITQQLPSYRIAQIAAKWGRHSLQLFAVSIPLDYLLKASLERTSYMHVPVACWLITLIALHLIASFLDTRAKRALPTVASTAT